MENETEIKLESLTEDGLAEIIKQRDEAKELAKKNAEDKEGVVNELIELRKKKAEPATVVPVDNAKTVQEIVAAQLAEADNLRATKALELAQVTAREKFLSEHKEFSAENDPSGIRRAALEKKLSRFNLNASKSEDDALEIFNDAYELLSRREGSGAQEGGTTPPTTGTSSRYVGNSSLTAKELGSIARLGWTREKFLTMKANHPDMVNELFK